jgi:hypothetical protein
MAVLSSNRSCFRVRVCVCVCVCVCVRVCGWRRYQRRTNIHTHTHTHIITHAYVMCRAAVAHAPFSVQYTHTHRHSRGKGAPLWGLCICTDIGACAYVQTYTSVRCCAHGERDTVLADTGTKWCCPGYNSLCLPVGNRNTEARTHARACTHTTRTCTHGPTQASRNTQTNATHCHIHAFARSHRVRSTGEQRVYRALVTGRQQAAGLTATRSQEVRAPSVRPAELLRCRGHRVGHKAFRVVWVSVSVFLERCGARVLVCVFVRSEAKLHE